MRVNLLIIEHAPRMASKKSNRAVHTQTLNANRVKKFIPHHQKNNPNLIKIPRVSACTILSRPRRVPAPNPSGP